MQYQITYRTPVSDDPATVTVDAEDQFAAAFQAGAIAARGTVAGVSFEGIGGPGLVTVYSVDISTAEDEPTPTLGSVATILNQLARQLTATGQDPAGQEDYPPDFSGTWQGQVVVTGDWPGGHKTGPAQITLTERFFQGHDDVPGPLGISDAQEPGNLAEALAATPPGHNFDDRELLNITRLGLSRIYTGPAAEVSEAMRECARQALAKLEGRDS
jgi:hypothetical protein